MMNKVIIICIFIHILLNMAKIYDKLFRINRREIQRFSNFIRIHESINSDSSKIYEIMGFFTILKDFMKIFQNFPGISSSNIQDMMNSYIHSTLSTSFSLPDINDYQIDLSEFKFDFQGVPLLLHYDSATNSWSFVLDVNERSNMLSAVRELPNRVSSFNNLMTLEFNQGTAPQHLLWHFREFMKKSIMIGRKHPDFREGQRYYCAVARETPGGPNNFQLLQQLHA